jgi:hypothetical protein
VNGVLQFYITAGKGLALFILHGTPKNSYYWYMQAIPFADGALHLGDA